jgi:hypothetical protein
MTKLVFVVYRQGRSQPVTNVSDSAYINRLRKQNWICTAGLLQFCCINGNPLCLYEGTTHRPLYILLYNFISTWTQPGSMQLHCIISHHRTDVERNYITKLHRKPNGIIQKNCCYKLHILRKKIRKFPCNILTKRTLKCIVRLGALKKW